MSKKERVKGKGADIFFSNEGSSNEEGVVERIARSPHRPNGTEKTEDLVRKATFYFTQSQLDALEKAVFYLRQEYRIETNKSEIMRIAIDMITSDFLANRKDSALYREVRYRYTGRERLAD